MADQELQAVNIDVPLFAGQDSSTDPRIVDKGALPLVENGRFYTNGQSQKRYGLTALSQHVSDGSTLAAGQQIFSAGNALYVRASDQLYVYNAPNNVWIRIGGIEASAVQSTVIAQSRLDVAEVASAANANAVAIVWREGTSLLLSVYSHTDGVFLQSATQLCADGNKANAFCVGSDFVVTYVDNSVVDLKAVRIPGTDLSSVGTVVTVSNTLLAPYYYDACQLTLATGDAGLGIVTRELPSAGTPCVNLFVLDDGLNVVSTRVYVDINWSSSANMWCFTLTDNVDSMPPLIVFGNGSHYYAVNEIRTVSNGAVPTGTRRIYCAGSLNLAPFLETNMGWVEIAVTALGNTQIYLERWDLACTSFTTFAWLQAGNQPKFFTNQNCYMASRIFADGKIWALADFKLQTQLVLLDLYAQPIGRALTNGNAAPNDGVFVSLATPASNVDSLGVTNCFIAARRRAQLKFDSNGNVSTTIGIALLNLRNDNACVQAVNVGGTTYIGGAAVQLFDGRSLTELGFWFYSDTPTLTENLGVGALSAGSYSWALCYAWYDNNGKLWRSPVILVAAGNATQPTGASGASLTVSANSSVTIHNITFLQGTLKQNVFIEIYRTKKDLTQYYKIAQIANVNALNQLTTTYTDAAADTALTGEILYTDGSQPSYLAPPGFAYLTATPNRLYGLASETNEVWASTLTSQTQPAQFLLGQTLGVPTLNTPPNAVELLDGNLYIFSEDAILTTGADGQLLSLTQTVQYVPPRALPVDAGCISPGSILRTEDGLWYQSSKGLMLLDRQQGTHFVGEFVKNYRDDVVRSALSMPDQQQLRFVASNQALVYDYVFKRWSIYTANAPAVSGCRWRDAYVRVEASGRVRKETVGLFLDDGTPYSRTIETPWIKAAGLNGYARCWRFAILGEGRAPHRLRVRIAYQYDPAWIDELFIDSTAQNAGGIYGNGLGPYGATEQSAYGASPPASYQFVGVMPRQKATAFKFQITDIDNTGTGEAAALTVLTLQCGVLGGLARLPASKGLG